MGTSNFYSHENGIFVLEQMTEETAFQCLLDNDPDVKAEDITDEQIQSEIDFQYDFYVEDFMGYLTERLEEQGYSTNKESNGKTSVWKQGKYEERIVAELSLEPGYYSHVQLIVETDRDYLIENYIGYLDTVTEELEHYTPHNKRLFKIVEGLTRPLQVVARFSNGETFYQ